MPKKKTSTPTYRNRVRMARKAVACLNSGGIHNSKRSGHGINCAVSLDFPSGKSIKFFIPLQWPPAALKLAHCDYSLSDESIEVGSDMLVEAVIETRDEFQSRIRPDWLHVSNAGRKYTDPAHINLFERVLTGFVLNLIKTIKLDQSTDPLSAVRDVLDTALPVVANQIERDIAKTGFRAASGVEDYAGLFPAARAIRRQLIFNVGPTNSGKTFHAMQALISADNGCYLAPLRLMALEGADRINAAGVPCDLLTGEESIPAEGANHISSTVEMLDTTRIVEVGVVDEVQMLNDSSRGWAWTRAIIGLPAQTIYLTGSADALPYLKMIATMCDDDLIVREHERLSPLLALEDSVAYKDIEDGDAIVAFSRKSVFMIRETLRSLNIPCAMLYGALGPEVRRTEAARFRNGEATVLVATDAIGMGLNLPIRRVLLSETKKFDGHDVRPLNGSEIRQICGRAGRYDPLHSTVGFAGVLSGNNPAIIDRHLGDDPTLPENPKLYAKPHWELVRDAAVLHDNDDLTFVYKWCCDLFVGDTLQRSDLGDDLAIAGAVRKFVPLYEGFRYIGAPVDASDVSLLGYLSGWAKRHGQGKLVPVPTGLSTSIPDSADGLQTLENAAKLVSLWLWLNMRWPKVYVDRDAALELRSRLSQSIETALRERVLSRLCKNCGVPLSPKNYASTCRDCDWS